MAHPVDLAPLTLGTARAGSSGADLRPLLLGQLPRGRAPPRAGALAVVLWIGAYAVVLGALLVAVGVRLHSWARRTSAREPPPGAVPATR